LLRPYKFILSGNNLNYQFTTVSGSVYNAYFTRFYLQANETEEIEIFSFGFGLFSPVIRFAAFDPRIKVTIQQIIADFFKKNGRSAIVYMCDQADGKARQRSLLFSRWFSELSETYIKCDSHARYAEFDFYSSIVIPNTNPDKGKLVDAFYYTLRYWMSE